MSQRVVIGQNEYVGGEELTKIGAFSQDAIDDLISDAIAYRAHWAGFTVSQTANTRLSISTGRYFEGRVVYENQDTIDIDLLSKIPAVASDEKWVALILRGDEVVEDSLAVIETSTDPETLQPVQQTVPRFIRRTLSIATQSGPQGPAPQPQPIINENDCAIAFIKLRNTGIEEIVMATDYRVRSLANVDARVSEIEVNLADLFLKTASLETDISNINRQLEAIPLPEKIRQIEENLGLLNVRNQIPQNSRSYRFDAALTGNFWDKTHADWRANILEGVRFPYAEARDAQLAVQNEADPNIIIGADRQMVPAYDEVVRVAHSVTSASRIINQLQNTTTTLVKKSVSRERISYGPSKRVCTNQRYWANVTRGLRVGETFFLNGQEHQLVNYRGEVTGPHINKFRYVRTVQRERFTETYWDAESETIAVNGASYSQTVLNPPTMILTGIDLHFKKVADDGIVYLFLCETLPGARPDPNSVIARSQLSPDEINIGWNTFPIDLTLLEDSKQYAWFTVTTGAHELGGSDKGEYSGGSSFVMLDGTFAQGDNLFDFAFRFRGARFRNVRTEIPFEALTLQNGMTVIDIIQKSWSPAATEIEWQIKPQGSNQWTTFEEHPDTSVHPLIGLPPLVELRLIMVGTRDLQPMITVDNTLRGTTGRHRGDMRAVSKVHNFGLSNSRIETRWTVDAWIDAEHTITPELIVGSTVHSADVTEEIETPENPEVREFRSIFNLPSPTTEARLRLSMTASNVVQVPFVQEVVMAATGAS